MTSFGNTGSGSSSTGQQQQQGVDAASTGRSFSSTSPFPPAPPYPSTFSAVHIPYKVPPDALPLVDAPIASGSGTAGLGGFGMSSLSLGNGLSSSNEGSGGRSSAFSPSKGTSDQPSQQQQQQQDGASQSGILRAVTDQVGYLEGESGEPYLKLYYYRVSGNTAIHPGINRICLKLQLRPPPPTSPAGSATAASGTVPSVPQPRADLQDVQFDPQTDMASPAVYEPLIELFYKVAGQHFPSIQRGRIAKRFEQGQMSAFLCNGQQPCHKDHARPLTLTLRCFSYRSHVCPRRSAFAPRPIQPGQRRQRLPGQGTRARRPASADADDRRRDGPPPARLGRARPELGERLLGATQLLSSFCSNQRAHALTCRSWHPLQQFSGLAIRMAVDLGFFSNTDEMYEDYAHFVRTKNLLWSLFMTDRLLALSTGRPCTVRPPRGLPRLPCSIISAHRSPPSPQIQESDIEIPLPLEEEVPEGPRPPGTENDPPLPSPFVWCTKLMVLCGRIACVTDRSSWVTSD